MCICLRRIYRFIGRCRDYLIFNPVHWVIPIGNSVGHGSVGHCLMTRCLLCCAPSRGVDAGWTRVDMFTPLLLEGVPGTDADSVSFFRGRGRGRSRRGLICPLLRMYKHRKAFCFRELDSLRRGPCTPLGLRLQTPYRGSTCYPPYILDLASDATAWLRLRKDGGR